MFSHGGVGTAFILGTGPNSAVYGSGVQTVPRGPLHGGGGRQGHAREGWQGRGRAGGLPGFTSHDLGGGGGGRGRIKGFSLNHYNENTLRSAKAHGRGSCQEALAGSGKALRPRSRCNYGNAPGLM